MADYEELIRCPACLDHYHDKKKPRQLKCGHSVCTACIEKMVINYTHFCPECRQNLYPLDKPENLPVNYSLLRLVCFLPKPDSTSDVKVQPATSELQADVDMCKLHGSPFSLHCLTCELFLCRLCECADYKDGDARNCNVMDIAQALDVMKNTWCNKASAKENNLHNFMNVVESELAMLKREKLQCEIERNELTMRLDDEVKKKCELDVWEKEALRRKEKLSNSLGFIKKKKKIVRGRKNVKSLIKIMKAGDRSISIFRRTENDIKRSWLRLLCGSNINSEERKQALKILLDFNVKLTAEVTIEDKILQFPISHKDDKVHVHSPPDSSSPQALTKSVPMDILERLTPKEAPVVFLDISLYEKISRVYMQLYGDSFYAHQFFLLCSGKRQSSFRNVRAIGVSERRKSNVNLVISGFKTLDENTDKKDDNISAANTENLAICKKDIICGLVAAEGNSFKIYLKDAMGAESDKAIGMVIDDGLDFIKEASLNRNVCELKVVDCGYVIQV